MTIDDAAIARVVSRMSNDVVASLLGPRRFDADGVHFNDPDDPELTARYILCVDAINFCFWPDHEAIRDAKAQRDKWAKYPVTAQYLVKQDGFDNDGEFKVPVRTEHEEGPNALLFQGLEYEHVAGGLRKALEADRGALDAKDCGHRRTETSADARVAEAAAAGRRAREAAARKSARGSSTTSAGAPRGSSTRPTDEPTSLRRSRR